MQRWSAFTFVEVTVVVGIMSVLAVSGFASYVRLENRQRVENAAKEMITFIRQSQMRARQGDRGTNASGCRADVADIATGNYKLQGWYVEFNTGGNELRSYPRCTTVGDDTGGAISMALTRDRLRNNLKVYCNPGSECDGTQYLFTKAVFGNTVYCTNASSGSRNCINTTNGELIGDKTHVIVVADTDNSIYYAFALANGSVTNGRFCGALTAADCFNTTNPE